MNNEQVTTCCEDCNHRCDPSGVCEKCGSDVMEAGDTRCVSCEARHIPDQRWRLYTYDLWTDSEGGKTVNDVYRSPYVLGLFENDTEEEVMTQVTALLGGDPKKLGYDHNSEGGDDTIYILDENGYPACELRREKEEV